MSSSDAPQTREWGRIFIGSTTVDLALVEGEMRRNWTPEEEAAYLERVRVKAAQKAAEILESARREADALREDAKQAGYAAGLAEAEEEITAFRSAMGDSVSSVLNAIEGQCSTIFTRWREELTTLLRLCVEKGVGITLSRNQAGVLEALYTQAVTTLENRRNLVIHVNPEDEPLIGDIVGLTLAKYPDLKAWSVKADSAVAPGGLTVESDDSLADNRLERRMALVNELLEKLTLPAE